MCIEEKEVNDLIKEILESMKNNPPTHCDRCGEELGEKFVLSITKVIFEKRILCESCNQISSRNTEMIRNALIESTNKLIGE